jgi:ABC-type nitrate/sulfonate/bicarbonate transport system permease component
MSSVRSSGVTHSPDQLAILEAAEMRERVLVGRRVRRIDSLRHWGLRLGTFALFAASWQYLAGLSDSPLLATFTETIGAFIDLAFVEGDLWAPMYRSNQAMVLGYVAAVVTAIPLGLAVGRFKIMDRLADPYVAILLAVPIAPLIPVVIVALGLGLTARSVIVYLFAFVFMSVNTRAGVRQVDESLPEMATSFGANEEQVWRLVVIPGSLPAIFAGLRIGLGRAIAGMVIVELLLVASGIGRLLLNAMGRFDGPKLFAIVLSIVLQSLILLALMRRLERKMAPWAQE